MRHFHPPIHAAVVAVTVVAGLASYQGVDKLVLARGGSQYGTSSEPGHAPSSNTSTPPSTAPTGHHDGSTTTLPHETGSTTSTTPSTSTTTQHEPYPYTSTTIHKEPYPSTSTTLHTSTTERHEPTPTTTAPKPPTSPPPCPCSWLTGSTSAGWPRPLAHRPTLSLCCTGSTSGGSTPSPSVARGRARWPKRSPRRPSSARGGRCRRSSGGAGDSRPGCS